MFFKESPQRFPHPQHTDNLPFTLVKRNLIEFYLLNCKYVMKFKKMAWSLSVQYTVSKLQSFVCLKLFLYVFFTINMCKTCFVSVCLIPLKRLK